MTERQKGKKIQLADARTGKRRPFSWLGQKPWFFPAMAVICFAGFAGAALYILNDINPETIAVAVICGGLGALVCLVRRRVQHEHFRALRNHSRAERIERELERFIVVLLRRLRLPIQNIKQKSKQQAELTKELREQLGQTELPKNIKSIIEGAPDGKIYKNAKSIWQSAVDMDTIPQGLLRLGHLRKSNLQLGWIDMNTLMVSTIESFREQIDNLGADIQMKDLPCCVGDKDLIEQAFAAIIQNALENLARGRKGQIRIWGWGEKKHAVYCIEDNGIGIEQKHLDKIFEIFYRVDQSRPAEGLGLSVVRRVVEYHRGRIWVKSTPGTGSVFSLSFPAKSLEQITVGK